MPPKGQFAKSRFDPARSSNPYITGEKLYRFVWQVPLCVRCGTSGHLPADCKGEELSKAEQNYLYALVKAEQTRSMEERSKKIEPRINLHKHHHPSAAAPQTQTPRPVPALAVSNLDAPGSPGQESSKGGSGLPSQSQAFEEFQAQQLAAKDERAWQRKKLQTSKLITVLKKTLAEPAEVASGSGPSPRPGHGTARQDAQALINAGKIGYVAVGRATRDDTRENVAAVTGRRRRGAGKADSALTSAFSLPHVSLPGLPPSLAQRITGTALDMGAMKRMSNGEVKITGPHPSTIRVSAPYITQSAVEKRLQLSSSDAQERSLAEAREDTARLQGVAWLDSTRRALQLPIRTYTTACVYYHRFRLAHPSADYNWADAAAASLLTSCKNEDTLKKSRDILAAAYNLKQPATLEQVGSDDPIFDAPSRLVIGLERLILESGAFDFRTRQPHHSLVKIAKSLPACSDKKEVAELAWTVLTDLHRTFAPLKQTSATLALACLELASHFEALSNGSGTSETRGIVQALDLRTWHTSREEVMETLLDALDLYTHHTTATILGSKYSLDDLLRIRLSLNKECSESRLPRYTAALPPPSPDDAPTSGTTLKVANGHPTPVSPPQPGSQAPAQTSAPGLSQPIPEGGGTLRFMLSPQRAVNEKGQVAKYYVEEWEEYEEEIEIPIPRPRSRERERLRERSQRPQERFERGERDARPRDFDDRRPVRGDDWDGGRGLIERDRIRDHERDPERDRARFRDRDRDRRYDDRRYDDRERDRLYDDRRDRDRDRDRHYYAEDRRRPRDDRR